MKQQFKFRKDSEEYDLNDELKKHKKTKNMKRVRDQAVRESRYRERDEEWDEYGESY
jgi:hypothetical protein